MEINAYQIPQDNTLFIQQNLVSNVSQNNHKDDFHIFFSQNLSYTQINGKNIFPTTTELGVELNHYFQTTVFCKYTLQNFSLDRNENEIIQDFWYCGNSFAIVPFAASVVHPKLKIYGGAGQAYGKNTANNLQDKTIALYFWSITPVLSAEVNISEDFKFNLGAGYQIIMSDNKNLRNISGIEATTSISYNLK